MTKKPNLGQRLNSVGVHLNRALRRSDTVGVGLALEHRSALSMVVFGGPLRMSDLASHERLSAPAITRTVGILERRGLVRRLRDRTDGRAQLIAATTAGKQMVLQGRDERARRVARGLRRLSPDAVARITASIGDLEALTSVLSGEDRGRAPGERA